MNVAAVSRRLVSFGLTRLYRVRSLAASLTRRETAHDLIPSAELDRAAIELIEYEAKLSDINWLRGKLRRYPYWRAGHLALARSALDTGQPHLAYASSRAVEKLSSEPAEMRFALHLTAKSLLQGSDPRRALQILQQIARCGENGTDVKEDLAACYMALESYREAFDVLSGIPIDSMSPDTREAYTFVKSKISD